MSAIANGSTIDLLVVDVKVSLSRPLQSGESLHVFRGSTDLGQPARIGSTSNYILTDSAGSYAHGLRSYTSKVIKNGSPVAVSPAVTVTVNNPVLATIKRLEVLLDVNLNFSSLINGTTSSHPSFTGGFTEGTSRPEFTISATNVATEAIRCELSFVKVADSGYQAGNPNIWTSIDTNGTQPSQVATGGALTLMSSFGSNPLTGGGNANDAQAIICWNAMYGATAGVRGFSIQLPVSGHFTAIGVMEGMIGSDVFGYGTTWELTCHSYTLGGDLISIKTSSFTVFGV